MAFRRSGPLRACRLADARRPLFGGGGAALHGGRWNSPGRRVIYAAETYAGALLEKLVHSNIGRVPRDQKYVEISVPPDVAIEEVTAQEIPGWDAEDPIAGRKCGDAWFNAHRAAVLLAPSLLAPLERNVLIHQNHPDARTIRVSEPMPVIWDERLFRRQCRILRILGRTVATQ